MFHDVVRVFLGLKDVYLGDASLFPRGRTLGEVAKPGVEVADPVVDVQDGHRQKYSLLLQDLQVIFRRFTPRTASMPGYTWARHPERNRLFEFWGGTGSALAPRDIRPRGAVDILRGIVHFGDFPSFLSLSRLKLPCWPKTSTSLGKEVRR